MGLFGFFKNKRSGEEHNDTSFPEVSRTMFLEDQDPLENMELNPQDSEVKGIGEIYFFLQKDYENRGYNDALTNPDESYRIDNINLLKQDLAILIQKVTTYYEDILKELDFHITSRSRAGLVDLVEILRTRKDLVGEHLKKVRQIREDSINNDGLTQRVVLSYQRGFMRGLSALTMADILKKDY